MKKALMLLCLCLCLCLSMPSFAEETTAQEEAVTAAQEESVHEEEDSDEEDSDEEDAQEEESEEENAPEEESGEDSGEELPEEAPDQEESGEDTSESEEPEDTPEQDEPEQEEPEQEEPDPAETAVPSPQPTESPAPTAQPESDIADEALWAQAPVITGLFCAENGEVVLTWSSAAKATFYVVYEVNGSSEKWQAVSRSYSATLSAPKAGTHTYRVVPYRTVGEKNIRGEAAEESIVIKTRAWHRAPKLSVSQISTQENACELILDIPADAEGFDLAITRYNGNKKSTRTYHSEGFPKDGYLALTLPDPEAPFSGEWDISSGTGDAPSALISTKKGKLQMLIFGFEYDRCYSFSVRTFGYASDRNDRENGKWSMENNKIFVSQWNQTPSLRGVKQISDIEPIVTMNVLFKGRPDFIQLYDHGKLIESIPVTNENLVSYTIRNAELGEHFFSARAVKDGKEGPLSNQVRFTVRSSWQKKRMPFTAAQTDENRVSFTWDALASVDVKFRYQLAERTMEENKPQYTVKGTTTSTSASLSGVKKGKHTYVIRPLLTLDDGTVLEGTWSNAVTVNVIQDAWAAPLKNTSATLMNQETGLVHISFDAIGKPDSFIVTSEGSEKTLATLPGDAVSGNFCLPKSGRHKLLVTPVKDGKQGETTWLGTIYWTPRSAVAYRALVIGNTYANTAELLLGPDKDAESVSAMLDTMEATPYEVTTLIGATQSEMLAAVGEAFDGADSNDISLFYFSGHGMKTTGNLLGEDLRPLPLHQLRAALDKVPGKKVVILDSCYSGASINKAIPAVGDDTQLLQITQAVESAFAARTQNTRATNTMTATNKSAPLADPDYFVITACSYRQISSSVSISGEHVGLFTYGLLRACGYNETTGAVAKLYGDTNDDGLMTFSECYHGACDAVESLVKGRDGYAQAAKATPSESKLVLFGR